METEETPLRWPEGWPRTRFQDRKAMPAWKKTYGQAVQALAKELKRLGATSWVVTRNVDQTDAGVAVWLTLKPVDNFGWQEALGFVGEVPTIKQIDHAYMKLVQPIHPDGPNPDNALFMQLTKHRDDARAWARGEQNIAHDKVMAIDAFKEHRWNVNAIRMTIFAMRQMERCGSGVMMERAWRGFSKQITAGEGEHVTVGA